MTLRVTPAVMFVAVALATLATLSVLKIASVPTDALFARVAIDDALYFVMPAHHFFAGKGFAFDGLHCSSGVQPLWAAIVLLVAGVLRAALVFVGNVDVR